ncbi:MAG: hypothetical protein E7H46_03435 [Staphylococcus epidermidis]|nr:hypothetical protein [Staphylococcus epidermidis]
MMDFSHYIPPVIIYAVLLAIHYFLSRTGNKILGLIVPVGVITSLVYMYQADIIHMKLIGVIIIGIVALLFLAEEWHRAWQRSGIEHKRINKGS